MIERYITPAELPTERQRELLIVLMEECAEIIHRTSKALRFGLDEIQPDRFPEESNAIRLATEIGDLKAVVLLLEREGVLDGERSFNAKVQKFQKLKKFLQTESRK